MNIIVVIGGGGHAKVLVSVLKKSGRVVAGYTDDVDRGALLGAVYLGNDAVLPNLMREHEACHAVLGVGKIDASAVRLQLQQQIVTLGFEFPVIVSPQAVINEDVRLGAGTVVFDGAIANSGTVAGGACILNTNCTVEHDCRLGDNVHVAPGATVSGGVTIGSNTMIGAGASILQGVSICGDCLIGMGAAVLQDITMPGTYVGCPASRLR